MLEVFTRWNGVVNVIEFRLNPAFSARLGGALLVTLRRVTSTVRQKLGSSPSLRAVISMIISNSLSYLPHTQKGIRAHIPPLLCDLRNDSCRRIGYTSDEPRGRGRLSFLGCKQGRDFSPSFDSVRSVHGKLDKHHRGHVG